MKYVALFLVLLMSSCASLNTNSKNDIKKYTVVIYDVDDGIEMKAAYFLKYYNKSKKISILTTDSVTIENNMRIFKIETNKVHDIGNE